MCLIFVAYESDSAHRLLVAANRDEFYTRPAAPAAYWSDAPHVLAGRDLEAGGTWLGVSRGGRFCALTNHRDPARLKTLRPSRGELVASYLREAETTESYVARLSETGQQYNGFSLLFADSGALWFFSNRDDQPARRLTPGVYGLSNDLLDTPWPKVRRGKTRLSSLLGSNMENEHLFEMMADRTCALTDELPDTGVSPEFERALSSMFIRTDTYGTRCTTIVKQSSEGTTAFAERSYDLDGRHSSVHFEFTINTN